MFSFEADTKELQKIFDKLLRIDASKQLQRGFTSALRSFTTLNKKVHNYKDQTGKLSKSHDFVQNRLRGALRANTPYAIFVHEGTKRHFIKPKKAGALAWMQGGVMRFSKGHYVSGITPRLWIWNNLLNNFDNFSDITTAPLWKSITKALQ